MRECCGMIILLIKMRGGMAIVGNCKIFMPNYLIKQLIQAPLPSHLDYGAGPIRHGVI